jgi:methionyl-tRNA formyltransferase
MRIGPLDTTGTLHDRLAAAGAALMTQTLRALAEGRARETPQPAEGSTYARKIRPKEARIRWDRDGAVVDRQIRGLSPFPGAWFTAPSEKGPVRVKALLSRFEDADGAPGAVLDDELLIACGAGAVRILRAQREGRAAQDAADFLRGFPLRAGAVLG